MKIISIYNEVFQLISVGFKSSHNLNWNYLPGKINYEAASRPWTNFVDFKVLVDYYAIKMSANGYAKYVTSIHIKQGENSGKKNGIALTTMGGNTK